MVLRTKRRNPRRGFTLMELLVVVAIIVMLAGLGTWSYMRYLEGARESKAKLDITHISQAVEAYKLDAGDYPPDLVTLTQPLENKPAALEGKDIVDPWGQQYVYEPQNINPSTFKPKIYSAHPTGGNPISNW
jgi:general secretion pathway protein G